MSVTANPSVATSGLVLALDTSNPRSYSPNTFPTPVDTFGYFGSSGTNNCTISRDTSISPSPANGIPLKMAVTGNDPYIATYASTAWSFAAAASGQTWTVSVWMRASSATTAGFFIFGAASSGNYVELANPMFSVTTEWQRFSGSITLSNASTIAIQVRFDGPDSGGSGVNIWYDGLQVEKTSSATTFNSFYNNNAATWYDNGGLGYNTSLLNGPNYLSSNLGILSFDGTNDYGNIGSQLNSYSTASIEGWFKSSAATYQNIIGWGAVGSGSNYSGIGLNNIGGAYSDESLHVIVNGSTLQMYVRKGHDFYCDGIWHQVVATIGPGNNRIYVDGIEQTVSYLQGTINTDSGGFNLASNLTYVGARPYGDGYMNGNISVIRVYNRILTQSEITQNFNAYRGRYGI